MPNPLQIGEVLQAVFDQVTSTDARATFRACLDVDHFWRAHALPFLFKKRGITSTHKLLEGIPPEDRKRVRSGEWVFNGGPPERLSFEVPYLTGLYLGGLKPDTLYVVQAIQHMNLVFARLRVFELVADYEDTLIQTWAVLPSFPQLRSVHIVCIRFGSTATGPSMVAVLPGVRELMLTAPDCAFGRLLAQMAALLPGNRTLDIGDIPLDVLRTVSALAWQECATLRLAPRGRTGYMLPPLAWPHLRTLEIGVCSAEQALATLACFTTAGLASLTILADERAPADDPTSDEDDLFEPLMALAGAHSTLVELHVSIIIYRSTLPMSGRMLCPLVGCKQMRSFAFAFGIDNRTRPVTALGLPLIDLLASAWPRLTELIVCHPFGTLTGTGATFAAAIVPAGVDLGAIHILQSKCPRLRTLQLVERLPCSLIPHAAQDRRHITVRILCAPSSQPTAVKSVIKTIWPCGTVWVDANPNRQGWNCLQSKRITTEVKSHSRLDW
ncbi:hypothetical protein CALCODRAFT_489055 [Calocera cornea HHB12733]|uniref:Uncharacterized protein n=1 Tax=Calocera cornea HHB12733 TaxID=1353952 RepID=A0A165AN04_9BASI|nr:hypothetical protein CALCODRAFT_489055 [Calocera cornea HHB12733]